MFHQNLTMMIIQLKTLLIIPLRQGQEVIGELHVLGYIRGHLTLDDLQL